LLDKGRRHVAAGLIYLKLSYIESLYNFGGITLMRRTLIKTNKAPAAIGPYSQAIMIENTLYTSGMLPIDVEGKLESGVVAQTHQIFTNLKAVLAEEGFDLEDVIKTTVFMTDLEHFSQMNEVYSHYFGDHPPARTTVEVSRLPKNADIEIELIAVKRMQNH
jgi:2-iminobutanoate/2-iminopropanoate deaminase